MTNFDGLGIDDAEVDVDISDSVNKILRNQQDNSFISMQQTKLTKVRLVLLVG